jgi:vitamin B12 transporter
MTAPAAAQESGEREDSPRGVSPAGRIITVLANGVRQDTGKTGQPLTVFTDREIEAVQGADIARLLERAPGVTFSRNGGPGGFTGVRVRGAEGEQLLVLVDGVRVADPASPGGGFDFGNLLMGTLARVELQRSSNSTIWGSQALGGVLAVTTGGNGELHGSLEYGAYDTLYATGGFRVSSGAARLDLQAAQFASDGFSSAAVGSEADGFRQTELAGRARVELGHGTSAFAVGRFADGRLELDGFPAPAFALADTAEYQDTRQLSGAAGLDYADRRLRLSALVSLAETERANFDPSLGAGPAYTTDGESERVELRGRWVFASRWSLAFGAEREWQRFSTLIDPVRRSAAAGAYAQVSYDRGGLHAAAGVRRDEHRDFGGQWSFGADLALDVVHGVQLTASFGEGFKAPTLFQLHSDLGNPALGPERSRSVDAGLSYGWGTGSVKLTAFRRDTEDLIGFVSCFGTTGGICAGRPLGTYDNIGRARAQGIEIEGSVRVPGVAAFGAAYTLLDAEDRTRGAATEGSVLARRPKHALTLIADADFDGTLRFGADLRAVSDSFDDAFNTVPLDGYATLTLRGEWDVTREVTLFGRIENLWGEDYQTAAGYATSGRAAYIGARAAW